VSTTEDNIGNDCEKLASLCISISRPRVPFPAVLFSTVFEPADSGEKGMEDDDEKPFGVTCDGIGGAASASRDENSCGFSLLSTNVGDRDDEGESTMQLVTGEMFGDNIWKQIWIACSRDWRVVDMVHQDMRNQV
jgi:hypothetical protein